MHYLWLRRVEHAIDRVRQRVLLGGHNVPERDIRRRFKRSSELLTDSYLARGFRTRGAVTIRMTAQ